MTRLTALMLALPLIAAAADGTPVTEEFKKQSSIYESRGEKVPEGYVIGRSLLSYSAALSPSFIQTLARLGAGDRWLDIGAGEGRAIVDYSTSKYDVMLKDSLPEGGKARAVAISIEDRRTDNWHQAAATVGPERIKYLYGKTLREYSDEELGGRFQMITDVFGGFSYTRDVSLFMEKALGLLDVGGTFYTVLQDVHWQDGSNKPFYANSPFLTEIQKGDGSEMKVCSWLKSISCVEVTCDVKDASPPVEMYGIKKVCGSVNVPPTLPVHFQAGTPPERRFIMTEATARK